MSNKQPLYVLSQLFYPELISTGLTLTELCESLSAKGQPIQAICAQPSLMKDRQTVDRYMTHQGIAIHRLASTSFHKANILGKALNHISFTLSMFFYCLFRIPKGSKLLVLSNPPILPLIMPLLKLFKRFQYHVLVFDVYPETLVATGFMSAYNPLLCLWKRWNRLVYKSAKQVIVIGRCMQSKIEAVYKGPAHNISFIPIWCDNKNIDSKSNRDFRKEWELGQRFVLGYSGNMARFHDIETFLEVAKELNNSNEICFVFVGEGHKKQWAIDFAKKHKLTNIQFHSYVPREDLGALLSTFDCGLVSLLPKNTGLSVPSKSLGLIAAQIPLLSLFSADCEIARLIEEHELGLNAEPGDARHCHDNIMTMYRHPEKIKQFKANCKRLADHELNLDAIAERFLAVIE